MTGQMCVIGVDPGPTPGLARMEFNGRPELHPLGTSIYGKALGTAIYQISSDGPDLEWLISRFFQGDWFKVKILAVEKFVIGRRSTRVNDPGASAKTREQVEMLKRLSSELPGVRLVSRSASEVKPWATEKRLVKAGFVLPKGMPHGTDAARHAMFAATHDGGVPDPLSAKAG